MRLSLKWLTYTKQNYDHYGSFNRILNRVEVIGTVIGYFAVTIASFILPFALAFAGGTMLYVISDEIIPDTHADGVENGATYALLLGFCLILIFDWLL